MLGAAILSFSLAAVAAGDYARPLGAKALDQATFDAESFGDKKALKREDEGVHVTLGPGESEAGWKTPQALRIGGDFVITATLAIRKLPKPGQEDGAAVGLAIATQNVDQPEATLVREIEPSGSDIYRPLQKAGNQGAEPAQPMIFDPFGFQPMGNKPAKPVRHTFPARGSTIRLEFRRQGQTVRYQVYDDMDKQPREVGQFAFGPGDVAGVKLFASNRSGAEPVDVVFRDLTVHAERITGLGTANRTVFGTVVHGDPTAIEDGKLVVGGPPPTPAPGSSPSAPNAAAGTAARPESKPAAPESTKAGVAPAPAAKPADEPKAVAKADAPAPAAKGEKPAQPAAPPKPPEPKARIPLDEVESVAFERASALAASFLGQPNVDTTMPGGAPAEAPKKPAANPSANDLTAPPPGTVVPPKVPKLEPKPNGIRDLHLGLSGLNPAAIRQVTVNVQTDKGPTAWRLDTSGSPDWPLTLARAGVESWADVFLEPPAGDCRDKEFTVMVNYADGQQAQAKFKATSATDPKLAFDPNAPAPALDARVYLTGDEQLFGKLETIGEESLGLTLPWGDRVDIPLARVVAVYMGMADHKESPDSFAKRLKAQWERGFAAGPREGRRGRGDRGRC